MVHPIDEVDVGDPSRAKHDIRALRSPFRGMAGLIQWPNICLHFDDLTREDTTIDYPNKILAD
jgi:hypothetical protein